MEGWLYRGHCENISWSENAPSNRADGQYERCNGGRCPRADIPVCESSALQTAEGSATRTGREETANGTRKGGRMAASVHKDARLICWPSSRVCFSFGQNDLQQEQTSSMGWQSRQWQKSQKRPVCSGPRSNRTNANWWPHTRLLLELVHCTRQQSIAEVCGRIFPINPNSIIRSKSLQTRATESFQRCLPPPPRARRRRTAVQEMTQQRQAIGWRGIAESERSRFDTSIPALLRPGFSVCSFFFCNTKITDAIRRNPELSID